MCTLYIGAHNSNNAHKIGFVPWLISGQKMPIFDTNETIFYHSSSVTNCIKKVLMKTDTPRHLLLKRTEVRMRINMHDRNKLMKLRQSSNGRQFQYPDALLCIY